MEQLLNSLKQLKNLSPHLDFLKSSREIVLATPKPPKGYSFYFSAIKENLQQTLNFGAAIGLAAALLYVASTGINSRPSAVTQKNNQDFNIHLNKARYYKEIAPNVYVVVLEDEKEPVTKNQ